MHFQSNQNHDKVDVEVCKKEVEEKGLNVRRSVANQKNQRTLFIRTNSIEEGEARTGTVNERKEKSNRDIPRASQKRGTFSR
jgi:hypothetical protein